MRKDAKEEENDAFGRWKCMSEVKKGRRAQRLTGNDGTRLSHDHVSHVTVAKRVRPFAEACCQPDYFGYKVQYASGRWRGPVIPAVVPRHFSLSPSHEPT